MASVRGRFSHAMHALERKLWAWRVRMSDAKIDIISKLKIVDLLTVQ
jgi:hypothetical protein